MFAKIDHGVARDDEGRIVKMSRLTASLTLADGGAFQVGIAREGDVIELMSGEVALIKASQSSASLSKTAVLTAVRSGLTVLTEKRVEIPT